MMISRPVSVHLNPGEAAASSASGLGELDANDSLTTGIRLDPLDTLFFRGGHPFEPGTRGASGLPLPQTFAGAVRTAFLRLLGCDLDALSQAIGRGCSFREALSEQRDELAGVAAIAFRGPWLAVVESDGEAPSPRVPAPATLLVREPGGDDDALVRLDPLAAETRLPGWEPRDDGLLPLWPRDRRPGRARQGNFLNQRGLEAFLGGKTPDADDLVDSESLYGHDHRTGIGLNPETLASEEGQIYAVSLLALPWRQEEAVPRVCLYAEIDAHPRLLEMLPTAENALLLPFGGEGRRVALRRVRPFLWPTPPATVEADGRLLLLTTPGFFSTGWNAEGLDLVAAAVPGHLAVSGWDLARGGPKPNRFAARAGSVYFTKKPPQAGRRSLCEGEDARLGYGCFLEGVWCHA